jgi:CelD/BcsL family acetyltransferase involved in cellulose biosynthesis
MLDRPGSPSPFSGSGRVACADATPLRVRTSGERLTLTLIASDEPEVEPIWRGLEAAARPSYFLTWGWIETWLTTLPAEARPQLAVIRQGERVVAACFLGQHRQLRHGLVPTRARHLNSTGIPQLDDLCVEHNAMLCAPGISWPLQALVEGLPPDWDELELPAIDATPLAPPAAFQVQIDREVSAPYVDLSRVRAAGDYLALLGANTRSQIRRARRAIGPSVLERASSVAEALEIYDELVELHTAGWRRRGQAGAFANPWFDHFHRRLIEQRFAHGEIELLRLRAGDQTIGCTYNLVAHGRTLFYQSGLAAFDDPRIKPGYLVQAAAIEYAASTGGSIYDLLGGDARYKASLATGATRLLWVRIQRRLARFAIEEHVRHWHRSYRVWRARPGTGA